MNFEQLVSEIQRLLAAKSHAVVAVSGFGGSGKTTLAEQLEKEFASDAVQINLDGFVINRGQGEGWAGGFDWRRFESLLKDIQAGKDLHYQTYDWNQDALRSDWIDHKLPDLVIVDGVRIFQPNLMPYFDLSVWVDVDLVTATTRGKIRDEQKWQNKIDKKGLAAHLQSWDEVWAPKEKEFIEKFNPKEAADFIYKSE